MREQKFEIPMEHVSAGGHAEGQPIRYFKAWLLFMLLSLLLSVGVGFCVGAVAGGIMGAAGVDMATLQRVCQVLGFLLGVAVSFICYRWSIQRLILSQLNPSVM